MACAADAAKMTAPQSANLGSDDCAYRHKLFESLGPYRYTMDPVFGENKERCFATSATVRLGRYGVATCDANELVDLDSEIRLGITRKLSRCPTKQLSERDQKICAITAPPSGCSDLGTEFSRLINPPCTLRERASPLDRLSGVLLPCMTDAQNHVEIPFAHNVNNRMLAKDMHRTCIAPALVSAKRSVSGSLPTAAGAPTRR